MTICATPIKGTVLRVVAVNTCGVPITGTGAFSVVSAGFVMVSSEPQYEDGEEFFERTADGTACVNQKDAPTLKRFQLTVDMCLIDPAMASYVADARLLTENAAVTGSGFAVREGNPETRFSLEVWQRVAGRGACDASGVQRYVYNAWPNVGNTQLGNYEIQNQRSTLQFIAETEAASPLWGDGPGAESWLPAGEVIADDEHWAWNVTTNAPPVPACGPTPVE